MTHHLHCVENIAIAVDHYAHGNKKTSQEEEEDEGGIIGVLGCPVQGAAQLVDLQRVSIPPKERCTRPGQGVQPDVPNGLPRPGEVHHLCVDHSDVPLIGQGSQSHYGNNAWQYVEMEGRVGGRGEKQKNYKMQRGGSKQLLGHWVGNSGSVSLWAGANKNLNNLVKSHYTNRYSDGLKVL